MWFPIKPNRLQIHPLSIFFNSQSAFLTFSLKQLMKWKIIWALLKMAEESYAKIFSNILGCVFVNLQGLIF